MPITSRFVVRSTIGLLAVGLLTLVAIVGATFWLGERAQIYFNDVVQARDVRTTAVELRNALVTAESSQRGYLATGNEIYLAPYASAKAQALRQLNLLTQTPGEYRPAPVMIERLTAAITEKVSEMDQTIALKSALRDAEAQAILRTNRGKALMDEANLFLSGIIRAADERLIIGVGEQRTNALLLRWVSIIGAIVIVLVIAIITVTVLRYTQEIRQARDEVRSLNASLERRVEERTADLARARDRAEVLLSEVNHRVANSLTLVASLIDLQSRSLADPAAKEALAETRGRIVAISSVHKRLYTSGDVRVVALDEYLSALLDQLALSMRKEGHSASLRHVLEPIPLPTDASVNLGVVVAELVTNAFKYAYPPGSGGAGEIRVKLRRLGGDRAELVVEDDGVGRGEQTAAKGTGIGMRIVHAMAQTMNAEFGSSGGARGTTARLAFPLQAA
jgi:two-component sensor histidine kinase/CHASE3 domain sensor protein